MGGGYTHGVVVVVVVVGDGDKGLSPFTHPCRPETPTVGTQNA